MCINIQVIVCAHYCEQIPPNVVPGFVSNYGKTIVMYCNQISPKFYKEIVSSYLKSSIIIHPGRRSRVSHICITFLCIFITTPLQLHLYIYIYMYVRKNVRIYIHMNVYIASVQLCVNLIHQSYSISS